MDESDRIDRALPPRRRVRVRSGSARLSHRQRETERGAATIEHVGLAIAVAALLAVASGDLRARAGQIGDALGESLSRSVSGHSQSASTQARGGARAQRVEQRSGGSTPTPVAPSQLQLANPHRPRASWWSGQWMRAGTTLGSAWRVDAAACAACLGAAWSGGLDRGAHAGSSSGGVGIRARGEAGIYSAVAAGEASVAVHREVGPAHVDAAGRVSGVAGAQAVGVAEADLTTRRQGVKLGGSAVAGAVARAEGRAGVELFGVALQSGAAAEGWAGAGAQGIFDVERTGGRLQWKYGWGAAVGLGGATEWSGSVDVSGVDKRHVKVAARSLRTAMSAAFPAAALGWGLR